jgi:microprocessor complex subunit DGCR8
MRIFYNLFIEKGVDPFEVLPEGWVAVTHNSGMPAYLHKQTRVCTLSKPYFLGPGSVRVSYPPLKILNNMGFTLQMPAYNIY